MKGAVIHLSFLFPVLAKSECQATEMIALRSEIQIEAVREKDNGELIQSNPISIRDQRQHFHRDVFLFFLPRRVSLLEKHTAS